jgi:hypothetical protein
MILEARREYGLLCCHFVHEVLLSVRVATIQCQVSRQMQWAGVVSLRHGQR